MKIAIFSSYYWPEKAGTAPYVTEPAEYLAAQGHEVHVAAGFPHYPQWRPLQKRSVSHVEVQNGVTIHRRPHTVPKQQDAASRAIYEASMLAGGLPNVVSVPKADVCVGVIPALSSGILAMLASRMRRRPFGLIVHDLMGKGALQSGISGARLGGLLAGVEARVAAQSDRILVLTDGFRDFFVDSGHEKGRIDVAPPWTRRTLDHIDHAEVRRRLGWDDADFVCVHAGNMGRKQGLSGVVEAAAILDDQEEKRIRFVLLGDGTERAELERQVAQRRLENVEFIDPAEDDVYDATLVAADALILHQLPSVSDMSMPSKLSAYLAAGRPVVAAASADSPAARVVAEASAGKVVDADPSALAKALRSIAALTPEEATKLGDSGRRYAAQKLGRDAVLSIYEEFMLTLRENPASSEPTG